MKLIHPISRHGLQIALVILLNLCSAAIVTAAQVEPAFQATVFSDRNFSYECPGSRYNLCWARLSHPGIDWRRHSRHKR